MAETDGRWVGAFQNKSAEAFAAALAEDVVLEAAVLVAPIRGRDKVKFTMGQASHLYESLEFTSQHSAGETTYLRWRATAFGGVELKGVTVLVKNPRGSISSIGIYHSPLLGALKFSEEMGRRTEAAIGSGYFYNP